MLLSPFPTILLERRILFVGGKGGAGKTTIAAALAVNMADRGRRCLVVSTDPAHSLGDVFGVSLGETAISLADRLQGLEIDPDRQAARHIRSVKQQLKGLVHPRMYGEVDRQLDLARSAPGTVEAAILERVAELMASPGSEADVVIFDTAPTGHTLRLLSLPEIMAAWTDGLLRHRERSSKLSSVLERFAGGPEPEREGVSHLGPPSEDPVGDSTQRINDLLRARRRKLGRARELLLDTNSTAFVLVLNPDRLSILEARKATESLANVSIPIAAVVVNRVLPPPDAGEEPGGFLGARRRQEAPYLAEIERDFAGLPRTVLPLLAEDVHGVEALRRVGRVLTAGA